MKIFIGCSASDNISKDYLNDCKTFLNQLFDTENDLVFGACYSGIMGIAHDVAKAKERDVIGICPSAYQHDFEKLNCSKEIVTDSINERTLEIIRNSDALVFLPGGIGTVYEMFMAIECKRCHEFDKPIVIYNSCGYYDQLFGFFDKIYDEKFALLKAKDNYFLTDNVIDAMNYISNYQRKR